MPKRSRRGLVEQAGAGGGADQGELGEVDAHRPCRRPFADDQVELEVLHCRVEDFLDRRIEAVDLVDEEHIALLEIGQQRRKITGLADDRTGGGAKPDPELLGHDLRQRRLAEARRSGEQHVVERIAARLGGLNEDAQVGPRLLLADEVSERLRADRRLEGVRLFPRPGHQSFGHALFLTVFAVSVKMAP